MSKPVISWHGLQRIARDEDAEKPPLEGVNSSRAEQQHRGDRRCGAIGLRLLVVRSIPRETLSITSTAVYRVGTQFNKKEENMMKPILKPGFIAFGFGLMLTTLGQAQPGAPSGTPLSFKVPPNALSAISFSTAPNVQCSVAPANGSGQAFTVYTNDEGTATFYVKPSQESSSAAQLVATCSSGNQQTIQIQPVAGAQPLAAPAPSNAATNARLGHTVCPALTGDPMALSNQELVKRGYPWRPDPQKAPGAYASWLKAVSKPATFIPPKTVNVEGRNQGPAKISAGANTQSARLATADTTNQTTFYTGASGYELQNATSQFVFIEGEWNVPALVGAENGMTTASTLSIGLGDVLPKYTQVTTGTEQDAIVQGGLTYFYYFPWTQISEQQTAAISNFTVNPGDQIYGEIWITDINGNVNPNGGFVNFYFGDLTTGQSTHFVELILTGIPFTGNSAQWEMGPSQITSCGGVDLCDLADYSFAVMTAAYAGDAYGNYVNYQGQGDIGIGTVWQLYMYGFFDNNILSTVYPINSDTMEFFWSAFH